VRADVFPFHRHIQDELYLVLQGQITIRFRNASPITLHKGESTVVRAKPKEMFPHPSEVE